jgi:hypothetical protein
MPHADAYIRLTVHYAADPPAEEFMEAADELGMFVELESELSLLRIA